MTKLKQIFEAKTRNDSDMPNGILKEPYPKAHHPSGNNNSSACRESKNRHLNDVAPDQKQGVGQNTISQQPPPDSTPQPQQQQSIACQEFAKNFLNAGYDMPTISRITPQDLTAIGITDPAKRLKILSEIKKLNLQDGIPNFRPANLSHWLSLLRLEAHYLESLCDQQIDTIDKMCQLTWEDFEELGITKLGHQKRMLLAIERMKELDSNEAKAASKSISEPIYDTNPSQILLVASAENHSMNGPIIHKQSSTSELSSTGSGSLHSVYSANSIQQQPTYATLPTIQQQPDQNSNQQHQQQQVQNSSNQTQIIYSQPPTQMALHQVPPPQVPVQQTQQVPNMPPPTFNQHSSHYQASQPMQTNPPQFLSPIYDSSNKRNTMVPQTNRQSLNQLPFSALANLPKHQQQLLQQSSIYATLGRQPQRIKQPPPPVPIRTNSLKCNSLTDEKINRQQSLRSGANYSVSSSQTLSQTQTNSANNLFRSGANKSQFNSQTLLTKNKSFSGNAYMDAARARFLNRNNHIHNHQLQQPTIPHQMLSLTNQECVNTNQNDTQNLIYGINPNPIRCNLTNGNPAVDSDNLSIYSRQSLATPDRSNTFNHHSADIQALRMQQYQQRFSLSATKSQASTSSAANNINTLPNGDEFDPHSDTNSTKSLILQPTSVTNSPSSSSRQTSLDQEGGSSQTLYNSASSGSNDQNINGCNLSQSGNTTSRHSTTSNSTLNDVNLILDQQQTIQQNNFSTRDKPANLRGECNATTGKDDDFPPPPSPLSLTDTDEHELLSESTDKNFNGINKGLMAFRVGI